MYMHTLFVRCKSDTSELTIKKSSRHRGLRLTHSTSLIVAPLAQGCLRPVHSLDLQFMSYDSTQVRATSEPKHALDTAEATFTTSSTSLLPPSSPSVVTPAARPTVRMPESSISFHRDHRASKGPIHYPFWFGGSASCCAAMGTSNSVLP